MADVKAVTRIEAILNGEDITPVTREEAILSGAEVEPLSREEYFVQKRLGEGGGGGGLPLNTTTVTANIVRGTHTGSASIDLPFPVYQESANPPRLDVSTSISVASNKNEKTQNFANTVYPCLIQPKSATTGMKIVLSNPVGCTIVADFVQIMEANASFTVTLNQG